MRLEACLGLKVSHVKLHERDKILQLSAYFETVVFCFPILLPKACVDKNPQTRQAAQTSSRLTL